MSVSGAMIGDVLIPRRSYSLSISARCAKTLADASIILESASG